MQVRWAIAVLAGAFALGAAAQSKDSFTPMALDAGFGPMNVSEPATPPEQIITKFAAKETEFQDALNHYTYRRIARVQTVDDDSKVDGEWYEVDDVIFDPSGRRTEKVVFAPESTLQRVMMSPSDLQDIQHGYPFVLTTADIGQYDVKYVGRQKVDEIDCYVFDVSPKQIEKGKRYLDGRIWVDATDLQIVVTDGRMVPDDTTQRAGGSAPALYDLAAADRWALLVSRSTPRARAFCTSPAAAATWPRMCTSATSSNTRTTSGSARPRRSSTRDRILLRRRHHQGSSRRRPSLRSSLPFELAEAAHVRAFSIQVLTERRAPSVVCFLHNGWEAADIFLKCTHSSAKAR